MIIGKIIDRIRTVVIYFSDTFILDMRLLRTYAGTVR